VRGPARLLSNGTTDVVEHVSIPQTHFHSSRQQHHGSEFDSGQDQRRGVANPRAGRRRGGPLVQHRPNRCLLLLRRLGQRQARTACNAVALPALPALQRHLRWTFMAGTCAVGMWAIVSVHAAYESMSETAFPCGGREATRARLWVPKNSAGPRGAIQVPSG
jgi:hypothetical protein